MAVFDFTPMQSMLGNEVCFIDIELELLIPGHHKHNNFSYVFGSVQGFCCHLTMDGNLIYSILVNGTYYQMSSIDILMLS